MPGIHLSQGFFVGILTKPDMLGDGAVNSKKQWLDVIEGRQHKLMHGYYCVRLPDDAQRAQRLSRAALQRTAMEYFDTTSPWSEVADRGRFGIPGFVTDISVLLVRHIRRVCVTLKRLSIPLWVQPVILQNTTTQAGCRAVACGMPGGDRYIA
jgi:hypothetical protein